MTAMLAGVKFVRDEVEILPTLGAEMSGIGLIGSGADANVSAFPLNTNVYFNTSDREMVAKLGSSGWLADAVRGIVDQLASVQGAAKVVVRRTDPGANAAAAVANVVGSSGAGTGIYGFLDAAEDLGITPRIIVAEHTDWANGNGIDSVTVLTQGSGYVTAPTVVFAGGGSDPGKVLPSATAVLGTGSDAGKVVSITITSPGANLTAAPSISFTNTGGGSPTSATASCTIAQLANPICAALPAVLAQMKAHAVVQGPSTSYAAWLNWRDSIQSERLIPTPAQRVLVQEGEDQVERDFAPRLAGLLVRRDGEFDGVPLHSAANQPVYGIVGLSRRVRFNFADPNTEGGDILEKNGGVVVRGEAGVESALGAGGFIYWGTDNLAEDPLWQFYHVSRGRDYIELSLMSVIKKYLGKFNITQQTVRAVINTTVSFLQRLEARGDILGFKVGIEKDKNSPEELRLGFLTIYFRAEEAPVLRKVTVNSRRYRDALTQMVNRLAIQLASIDTVQ